MIGRITCFWRLFHLQNEMDASILFESRLGRVMVTVTGSEAFLEAFRIQIADQIEEGSSDIVEVQWSDARGSVRLCLHVISRIAEGDDFINVEACLSP